MFFGSPYESRRMEYQFGVNEGMSNLSETVENQQILSIIKPTEKGNPVYFCGKTVFCKFDDLNSCRICSIMVERNLRLESNELLEGRAFWIIQLLTGLYVFSLLKISGASPSLISLRCSHDHFTYSRSDWFPEIFRCPLAERGNRHCRTGVFILFCNALFLIISKSSFGHFCLLQSGLPGCQI